jgi:outer membrane protein insertion porin family
MDPFSPKVHGVAFFDAGDTWNTFRAADLSQLRKGAGLGIRVDVPMLGQLGLDYGYGFNRLDLLGRPDRGAWQLHFNFGPMVGESTRMRPWPKRLGKVRPGP